MRAWQKVRSRASTPNIKRVLYRRFALARLRNRTFCVVSNNCWRSTIYQDLGFEYNTPFVGLYFYSPCYIRLLSNLSYYLSQSVEIIETSRYPVANEIRARRYFPTGLLGKDVEIRFLHYKTPQDALEKWDRRRGRMDSNNLFVAFSDVDLFEDRFLDQFEASSFEHKVFFTSRNIHTPSAVCISEHANQPDVGNLYTESYLSKRHFDVVDWLNGGTGRPTSMYSLINKILEK